MPIQLVNQNQPDGQIPLTQREQQLRISVKRKRKRDEAYCALELLLECLRMTQRHRGAVMGYLSNQNTFKEDLHQSRDSVDACLKLLADFHATVDKRALVRITEEWQTARHVDAQDTPLQQYEIHCNLAREIIHLCWKVVDENDYLMQQNSEYKIFNQVLIKDFLILIENIGRCRALGTLITASKSKPRELKTPKTLLKVACEDVTSAVETIYLEFSHCGDTYSKKVFGILSHYDCRFKISRLDKLLKDSILTQKNINISAESIFYLFTMVMDEQYKAFKKSLAITQNQPLPVI